MFANDFSKTHQQITHGQMLGLSTANYIIVSGGKQWKTVNINEQYYLVP